jgi:site-specific DNA-methyltransferase (adenine-specific)
MTIQDYPSDKAQVNTSNVFSWKDFQLDYPSVEIGMSTLIHADCFEWLGSIPESSLHAIVTDPPYGVKEYNFDQLQKRSDGSGGVWRIPPSFDGNIRSPLPRFTALNDKERQHIRRFFVEWATAVLRVLRPGAHVFVASNSFMAQLVFEALTFGGLEYRGTIIRTVRTMRGGDRPKNFEEEFSDVCSLPRGCYEPWGLFRKPMLLKMKVGDCLREFQTGGLRRRSDGKPFEDVIDSTRTPKNERMIANHPSIKPQAFIRQLVYAVLPLGEGVIADPFMGSGSTIAAAEALKLRAIGVEKHVTYFEMAKNAVRPLSLLYRRQNQANVDLA